MGYRIGGMIPSDPLNGCRRGGIGRRDRLRICYPLGCGGSNPLVGTDRVGLRIEGLWTWSQVEIAGRELFWARGLVGRRLLCTQEIAGSNPAGSTSEMFSIGKGSDSSSLPFPLPGEYLRQKHAWLACFVHSVQFPQRYGGKPNMGLSVRR